MDATFTVEARQPADELRSLRRWLLAEEALRGRVRLVARPPTTGELGGELEALTAALAPGGVATAAAGVLIAWIRRRTSDVRLTLTREDGTSLELRATQMSKMDSAAVADLVRQVTMVLDGPMESG